MKNTHLLVQTVKVPLARVELVQRVRDLLGKLLDHAVELASRRGAGGGGGILAAPLRRHGHGRPRVELLLLRGGRLLARVRLACLLRHVHHSIVAKKPNP